MRAEHVVNHDGPKRTLATRQLWAERMSRVRCRSVEGAVDATVVSSALAAVMASRMEFRSLPKDASSAMLLCNGASFMYLRMESEPHRPWSCIRHTSMPQEARCIAPVALNVWPENRGAPVIV